MHDSQYCIASQSGESLARCVAGRLCHSVWKPHGRSGSIMLAQGRYLPGLDHGVPPDVSWDSYRYFYDRLRPMIAQHPPRPE